MNPLCKLPSFQVCKYFWRGPRRCRRWCQTRADRMTESFQFQSEWCINELLTLSANIHLVPNLSTTQFSYYVSQESERFRWHAWQRQKCLFMLFVSYGVECLEGRRKSAALVFVFSILMLEGQNRILNSVVSNLLDQLLKSLLRHDTQHHTLLVL